MGRWREAPEGLGVLSSPFMGRWREAPEGLAQAAYPTCRRRLFAPTGYPKSPHHLGLMQGFGPSKRQSSSTLATACAAMPAFWPSAPSPSGDLPFTLPSLVPSLLARLALIVAR